MPLVKARSILYKRNSPFYILKLKARIVLYKNIIRFFIASRTKPVFEKRIEIFDILNLNILVRYDSRYYLKKRDESVRYGLSFKSYALLYLTLAKIIDTHRQLSTLLQPKVFRCTYTLKKRYSFMN